MVQLSDGAVILAVAIRREALSFHLGIKIDQQDKPIEMLISDHAIVFRMRQVLKSPSLCSGTKRAFLVGRVVGRS